MATIRRASIRGGIARLEAQIKTIKDLELQVGWFEGARYADKKATPVAAVAAQNEVGSPAQGIPARPFMRPAIADNRAKWKRFIGVQVLQILDGRRDVKTVMEALGLNVAGSIRKAIRQVHHPALAEITILNRIKVRAKKKVTLTLIKPLVFEGILFNSVAYVVKGGSEVYPFGKKEPKGDA